MARRRSAAPRFAAFYGSLRRGVYDPEAPRLAGLARHLGSCRLRGRLVDHGPYPGFFPGSGASAMVAADLVEILDLRFFAVFDDWEDYRPGRPAQSLYLRRVLRLAAPDLRAWVYISNQSPADPEVPRGDWVWHQRTRRTAPWTAAGPGRPAV